MKILPLALLAVFGFAAAQITAPAVTITPTTVAPASELARSVIVQPSSVEVRLGTGRTTGTVSFSLLSEVNTEVFVEASDARLVNPRAATSGRTPVALRPYAEQTVSFVAMAAHSGTVRVRNGEGQIIAEVPYTVAPAKVVNQSASVNYSPSGDRVGLSYSVGGVPQSALDPRWNVNVNVGVTPGAGTVSGSVSISVNW